MKNKILTVIVLSYLGYYYTHTINYISNSYDNYIRRECDSDIMCKLGATLIKDSITNCMQDSFFSTSKKTIERCIDKYGEKTK